MEIVIILLVIVGVIMWLVNTYIPMEASIKKILNIAVVVVIVLWLLTLFFPGLGGVGSIRVGG